MSNKKHLWVDISVGVASLALVAVGLYFKQTWLAIAALPVGGLVCLAARLRRPAQGQPSEPAEEENPAANTPQPEVAANPQRRGANDSNNLIEDMLEQGRFALLLRPQIVENLSTRQLERAVETLEETMALVPEGDVLMYPQFDHPSFRGSRDPRRMRVETLYLDRYPVTNAEYYKFVSTGGYEQIALWDPEILPGLLEFVDQTGHPGPRFWKDGCYLKGEENHPVVGVSWYEAAAYSGWIGKRLPTDPEWVKAGCWPVDAIGDMPVQRKYPWGDAMDRQSANLWKTGPGRVVPVDQFPDGMSVGGVYQLIGNVWEWTQSNYGVWDEMAKELKFDHPVKSIRGGAFDTYFENQATCQFQSGDNSIVGKHNIGFRCAVGVCDLAIPNHFDDFGASQGEEQQDYQQPAGDEAATVGETS